MRILIVLNGPENDAERSILERRDVALFRQLRAQGVDVNVALFGDQGGLAVVLRRTGVPVPATVIPIALPPRAAALFRIPAAVLRLRKLIQSVRPDLVEATEPIPAIAAALAARRTTTIYRRQHDTARIRVVLASRLAASLADRTIVSCEAMRQQAVSRDRTNPARIDIATPGTAEPPAISDTACAAIRHAIGIPDGAKVIAAISRFRREKGLDTLIRAIHGLSDVHLIIAGNGPEEPHLRALAAQSPHPIHFLGHRDDIAHLMRIADVVAIPSRRESFGRVVLEAMANGRPVVATRAGGLAEAVVDGETGLLVPVDDEQSLAGALQRLLTDDALAGRLGDAARERYRERYTIAHMASARRAAWERSLT